MSGEGPEEASGSEEGAALGAFKALRSLHSKEFLQDFGSFRSRPTRLLPQIKSKGNRRHSRCFQASFTGLSKNVKRLWGRMALISL